MITTAQSETYLCSSVPLSLCCCDSDNIGNRTKQEHAYDLNQLVLHSSDTPCGRDDGGYTERTVPDSSDIIGSAETNVTVTVNTNTATRQDYYWYHRLEVDNLYTAAYPQVVVEAVYDPGTNEAYVVSSETGSVFVAESPEVFSYDDDGNLLVDGRFEYAWDCENRLISATTITNLPADVPVVHVEFAYDYMSRRVGETVYEWDAGVTNWTLTEARENVFDGWALIREDISGATVTTNWYVHGLDLSGSLTGAGGVGGLLAATFGTNTCAYAFDGNGNVSELINAQTGEILAHYQYSPFGETIVATGELALENKFRFSTKYFDDETGLSYYGYRYYSPSMGRFISEDPLDEIGSDAWFNARKSSLIFISELKDEVTRLLSTSSFSQNERNELLRLFDILSDLDKRITLNDTALLMELTGSHGYLLCTNDPLDFYDPLGLKISGWKYLIGAGGALVGGTGIAIIVTTTSPVWITAGVVMAVVGGGMAIYEVATIWGTAEDAVGDLGDKVQESDLRGELFDELCK